MRIIGGRLKGRELKTPKTTLTRPTSSKVKESVFNMLQYEIEESSFLDLFAGSGAMGIEALSRGANQATFVEKDKVAAKILRENLLRLDLEGTVIQADVFDVARRMAKKGTHFDIIYIDPPYTLDLKPLFQDLPFLLEQAGALLIEQAKGVEINLSDLQKCSIRNFGDTSIHFFRHEP